MNYFNYFTEIEDAFIRRRAKHLMLSPVDWALIESWKEMDVPLHVVLRGIEKAFDSWESKPRKRSVKSLLYCQEEIEAQFAEWREARVGSGDESSGTAAETAKQDDRIPFSRTAIQEHLERGRARLAEICGLRKQAGADDFTDALERTVTLLAELERDFAATTLPDAQKLEQSLSGLERMLSDAIRLVASPIEIEAIENEVKEQLKPYRKQMDKVVYEQTVANLLLKRLREQFGVPRLSLFYL